MELRGEREREREREREEGGDILLGLFILIHLLKGGMLSLKNPFISNDKDGHEKRKSRAAKLDQAP